MSVGTITHTDAGTIYRDTDGNVFYFDQSYEAYPPIGESGPVFVTPTKENAEFLAHARTDLPRLVQMLRLATDELAHLHKWLGMEIGTTTHEERLRFVLVQERITAALADLDALAKVTR